MTPDLKTLREAERFDTGNDHYPRRAVAEVDYDILLEKYVALCARLEAAEKWISVEERLPPYPAKWVLTYNKAKTDQTEDFVSIAIYSANEGWGWTKGDGNHADDIWSTVTHWRSLPAPPER